MAHNQEKLKDLFLDNLTKIPNISLVCEKVKISRATFYRWRILDDEFNNNVELALEAGQEVINDLCESKIVSKIQEGDSGMIKYWLSHHNERYKSYTLSYREKRIMQMPLIKFQGSDGIEYDSFEEYSIADKKRVQKIVEENEKENSS